MDHKPEHIDKAFQERLQHIAPPPPAFVWDEIERALRKKRRRFLILLFAGGLAGVGVLGYWMLRADQSLPVALNNPVVSNRNTGVVSTNDAAIAAIPDQPAQVSPPVFSDKLAGNHRLPTFDPHSAKAPPGTTQAQQTDTPQTVPKEPVAPANNHIKAEEVASSEVPDSKLAGGQTITALPLPFGPLLRPADNIGFKPGMVKSNVTVRHAKKTVHNCYDFSKRPLVWMVEGFGGPSLAQRELVASPDDRPYLNQRLNTEHPNVAFNAGIRTTLVLQGNFLLRTGLQYDQFTEVFEHIDPDYIKYIVEIVNQGGHQTIDTVGVEYGEEYLKTYNRYGMLDLPLQAGFEFRKGRSGFNFNAGVAFNLLFWKRGAIISPDTGEPVYFTPGKAGAANIFKTQSGVSASASVQWFYHLRPRLRVFVEPYFKRVLKPLTLPTHPVEQRYGIAGLRLGFSTILN